MNWSKKKISAVSTFIMGAFMLAVGNLAEAQEVDASVKETFPEKCGVVDTRGQLYECTVYTSEEESNYQSEIWATAIKDKDVYEAVGKDYLYVLRLPECKESNSAALNILLDAYYSDESNAQEALSGELLDSGHKYFSHGKTCLMKTAEVYGKHGSLKDIVDKYRDLSDKMGQVSVRLPVPKLQS